MSEGYVSCQFPHSFVSDRCHRRASRQGRSLRKRTPIDYAEGSSKGSARDTTLRSQRIYKERGRTRVLSGLMYVPVDIFLEVGFDYATSPAHC